MTNMKTTETVRSEPTSRATETRSPVALVLTHSQHALPGVPDGLAVTDTPRLRTGMIYRDEQCFENETNRMLVTRLPEPDFALRIFTTISQNLICKYAAPESLYL